jgi:ketosteroid isomerase-like protein
MLTKNNAPEAQRLAVVRAMYKAYVDKDRVAIETLIADDFHFTSPLDNRIGRAAYFNRCWPNSELMESFTLLHIASNGEHVFVTYEGRRKDYAFQNTELVTVRDGQVLSVEVYFGWTLPHAARPGGFVEKDAST